MSLSNHKSQVMHSTICLWTHSDGAHGDEPYHYLPLPLPAPTPTYSHLPLPLPTPPTPTTPYHHPPLPQIMVLKEANS